jgi:hypothetical protein
MHRRIGLRERAEFWSTRDCPHIDLNPNFILGRASNAAKLTHPSCSLDTQNTFASTRVTQQRLAEASNPIARDLGLGSICVQEHHASIISLLGRRKGQDQAISPDTSVPVTQRARQL